jgi:UDP-N-acetylmuramate dehydrogenase
MSIAVPDRLQWAEAILRLACGERLRTDLPLAPLTSFRIGGPAALYLEPRSEDDLAAAGRALRETGIPVAILGKGSNVLVADDGFTGLVIRLGRSYRWAARDGERLTAGGAMPLPALAGVALRHGLAGLEFGVAIPASLGGAVKMNAGAHEGSMSDVVEGIEVYRLGEGVAERLAGADAGFAYRRSALPLDSVVVGATLALGDGDPGQIREQMDEARRWRRRTQPLAEPNCGSVFTNPSGDHAARLVEAAGMKGFRSGGASVSLRHANFIVADPGARAADVLEVIDAVRSRVIEHDGVTLDLEVQLIGEFAHGS